MQRREWLIIFGLSVLALALSSANGFGGGKQVRDWDKRVEEYRRATYDARQAKFRREADRKRLLEQPAIRAAWIEAAHDRFTAVPAPCDLIVKVIGKGHVRGIVPRSAEDRVTGDLLQLTYGSYGDRYMKGSLRVGPTGQPSDLIIWATEENGRALFIVNAWQMTQSSNEGMGSSEGRTFLDDKAMNVLARMLNCNPSPLQLVGPGKRPIILDRPMLRYAGPDGFERYSEDRNAFLDEHVDHYYAASGKDPSTGRFDPKSIPKPVYRQ